MKKGIIAISLLLTGALLVTPLANAITQKDVQEDFKPVKVEQTTATKKEDTSNEANDKTTQTKENKIQKEENNISVKEENNIPVKKEETVVKNEESVKEPVKEEVKTETTETSNEAVVNEDKEEEAVVQESGMSRADAEAVLNKYLREVENVDFTYTYKGDENTFKAMQEKGIRGYVFLPNVDTDMAYLVDKDNGSIYFFHPSGYFELLK